MDEQAVGKETKSSEEGTSAPKRGDGVESPFGGCSLVPASFLIPCRAGLLLLLPWHLPVTVNCCRTCASEMALPSTSPVGW